MLMFFSFLSWLCAESRSQSRSCAAAMIWQQKFQDKPDLSGRRSQEKNPHSAMGEGVREKNWKR